MPDYSRNALPMSDSRKALLAPLNTQLSSPGSPQTFMASPTSYSHDFSPKDASSRPAQNARNTPSPLRRPVEGRDHRGHGIADDGKEGMRKGSEQVVTVEGVDEVQHASPSADQSRLPGLRDSRLTRSPEAASRVQASSKRATRKGKEREQDLADLPICTEEDAYLEREERFFLQGGHGREHIAGPEGDHSGLDGQAVPELGRSTHKETGDSPMLGDLRRKMDKILDAQAEIRNMHEALEDGKSDTGAQKDLQDPKRTGAAGETTSPNAGNVAEEKVKKGTDSKDDDGLATDVKSAKKAGRMKQRQDDLDQMFDKLSHLSTMLREYHSLPQPSLYFPTSAPTNPSSPNTPTNPFTERGTFPASTLAEPLLPSQRPHTTSHTSSNTSFVHGRKEKEPRPIIIPMSSPELDTAPPPGKESGKAKGPSGLPKSSLYPTRRSTEPYNGTAPDPIDPAKSGKGKLAEMSRPETAERKWSTVLG